MGNAQNELNEIEMEISKKSVVKHERFNTESEYLTFVANNANSASAGNAINNSQVNPANY